MAKSNVDVFLRLHGQRKFSKELITSGNELEAMGVKGAAAMASFANSSEKLKKFGRSWTTHVSLPVAVGAGLAVKAAIDWESAFTGVRKTVNATEAQYASMERGIRNMSLHIPVAATELAGIAEAAGQLGVERKSILSFTRTIADLGVSTNLAGEEGATTLARFANITQMPQSQFRRLGSTIVALGNAGASTESDIAAMGLRIAAAGNFVGMTEPQILGIANALSSVGIEAEAGGTSASQAIKVINSAVAEGGKKLASFADIANMGSKQFAAAWTKDPASALTSWIEGLARLKDEGKDVPALLNDLDPKLRGTRVQDTLLRAAGAGALFRESLSLGAKAWEENNALSREAGKRYKTVASQLQILKNKIFDAGVSLGQELLPSLIKFVNIAGPAVGQIAHGFAALPGPIQASALGFLVLTGPVASGLGYFAQGIGRLLVMTNGLAKFGQVFSSAMSEAGYVSKLTLTSSFNEAWAGTGAAAAMQAAKGFAYIIGPSIAAYGVANIVTSATNGDWRDAGFEMGGAAAGGIAGFMLGGPLRAMLGVGLGSLGGELASSLFGGLFGGSKKTQPVLEKLARSSREVSRYFHEQKEAGVALGHSSGRVSAAHARLVRASKGLRGAENLLTTAKRRSGRSSDATAKAEWRLALAQDKHRRASNRLRRSERERGQALRWFKQITRSTVLEERNQINNLQRRKQHIKTLYRDEERAGASSSKLTEIARRGIKVSNELSGAQRKYKETLVEAGQKAGPKFAKFLSNANRSSLEFGSAVKSLNNRLRVTKELTLGLSETNPFAMPSLGNLGSGVEGLPAGPPVPFVGPKRTHKRRQGGNSTQIAPLPAGPRPRRRRSGDMADLIHVHVLNENKLHLDGKEVAENTTKHSRRAANRE